MDTATAAKLYGLSRVAFGAGLVAAPGALGRPWIGAAADGGGEVALRALGIRDLVMGGMCAHVAGRPEVAQRWMAACAVADAVDLGATVAARGKLPGTATGVMAVAATGTAIGLSLARAYRR